MTAGKVIFVSDIHLYYGGADYLKTFTSFLRTAGAQADTLYIHGDLFDFYVGPRQGRQPFYQPLFSALEELVTAGVRVHAIRGNRDFLVGKHFRQCGITVLPDASTLELGRYRVHLSHGDEFCIHDHSYLFWARGVLRSLPIRFLVRNLPVCCAIWLARRYRKVSEAKGKRLGRGTGGRLSTILDGVNQLLSRDPHHVVICGHIHELAETPMPHEGGTARLLTTGAWEDGPNCILFDGADFQLMRYAEQTGLTPI